MHPVNHAITAPSTIADLYDGRGSCGVMSTRGSAMRPLWFASMTLLRGMTVAMSLTWTGRFAARLYSVQAALFLGIACIN